jgi:membrane protein implicated in regulation of membrane protease activity
VKKFLKDNGLTLAFTLLLLLSLVGQAISGVAEYNSQAVADGVDQISLLTYLGTSDFGVDVAENWQSEYLQFFLYVFLTVWLVQRGSTESKTPDEVGLESDEDQLVGEYARDDSPKWARARGWRLAVYSRSLGLVMGLMFLGSWLAQSIAGQSAYNEEQLRQLEAPVSWVGYVASADFWNRTLQNWQSEFLAVASMSVLSIYLRQRGSPESKPVGAPHSATGVEG